MLRYIKQMFSFWGFWNFCFQFVSLGCFRFWGVLIFSTLQFGSRFSRNRSRWNGNAPSLRATRAMPSSCSAPRARMDSRATTPTMLWVCLWATSVAAWPIPPTYAANPYKGNGWYAKKWQQSIVQSTPSRIRLLTIPFISKPSRQLADNCWIVNYLAARILRRKTR